MIRAQVSNEAWRWALEVSTKTYKDVPRRTKTYQDDIFTGSQRANTVYHPRTKKSPAVCRFFNPLRQDFLSHAGVMLKFKLLNQLIVVNVSDTPHKRGYRSGTAIISQKPIEFLAQLKRLGL